MIRFAVCVLACWMALSHARPADQTPTAATVLPTVGSSAFPFAAPSPFTPGVNNPYYNYNGNAPGPAIPILTYSNEHAPDGSYSYSFSTADGKQVQEAGYLKDAYVDNNGEPQGTQVVQGSYAYVSPEGTPIQVTYVADENGFRPSGVHIPADGKALPPLAAFAEARNRSVYDPEYNRYNPFYNNNNYNNNRFGAYNRPYDSRYPYDARYPYDPRRPYDAKYPFYNNRYNPYRPTLLNNDAKDETKKE